MIDDKLVKHKGLWLPVLWFILVATICFRGEPDLIQVLVQWLMKE